MKDIAKTKPAFGNSLQIQQIQNVPNLQYVL